LSTGVQTFMSQEQWKAAEQEFGNLLKVLESNRELVVIENAEEWEDDDKAPTIVEGEKFKIPGSIVSYVERLDDELTRSLQHIDPHTAEYIDRLSDEGALYNNIVRTLLYTESLKKDESLQVPQDSLNRIVMRRLEHVYFKVSKVKIFRGSRLTSYSQQQLSKFWKKIVGSRSQPRWTLLSLLAAKFQMPLPWSTSSATTFSSIAKASSVLELCFARYTSLLSMTITTRLAI
jgi:hypothetical protein